MKPTKEIVDAFKAVKALYNETEYVIFTKDGWEYVTADLCCILASEVEDEVLKAALDSVDSFPAIFHNPEYEDVRKLSIIEPLAEADRVFPLTQWAVEALNSADGVSVDAYKVRYAMEAVGYIATTLASVERWKEKVSVWHAEGKLLTDTVPQLRLEK